MDNIWKNAFKEVYDILQNTDEELLEKIPNKFMNFIKNNMNEQYETDIKTDVEIDKQSLLKETESVLALIYRSYWATEEEKHEFAKKDREEALEKERLKKENFKGKNIEEIFEERRNIDNITIDNNLMVIKKESFIKKIFNKIKKFFKK